MKLLDYAIKSTNEYMEKMPKSQRKKYGQFFTSRETAIFMAYLFDVPCDRKKLHILDAGAGSGILSVALIDRLQTAIGVKSVSLTCYETDSNVLDLLRNNLDYACANASLNVDYEIKTDNYILSQMLDYNEMLGADPNPQKYDLIIGNPPYMKVAKDAPEAQAMPDVCYGAPNLYFLFASMGMFNLIPEGEMVYIIPRSWTSGAYFKSFRQKFLNEGVLEHIHLFESRDKVFDQESVLQETMIIKVIIAYTKEVYVIAYCAIGKIFKKSVSIIIRQTSVSVSGGDIFEAPELRVIGCDTHFDTRVCFKT